MDFSRAYSSLELGRMNRSYMMSKKMGYYNDNFVSSSAFIKKYEIM